MTSDKTISPYAAVQPTSGYDDRSKTAYGYDEEAMVNIPSR